eukprot:2696133-Pyramimonas_sp.AAC.1
MLSTLTRLAHREQARHVWILEGTGEACPWGAVGIASEILLGDEARVIGSRYEYVLSTLTRLDPAT